jgi:hypothetical protein
MYIATNLFILYVAQNITQFLPKLLTIIHDMCMY